MQDYNTKFSYFSQPMPVKTSGRMKALIVDDETDICYLLSSILRERNVLASFAGSLNEADRILEQEAPPLIFLDNHLPDGMGMDYVSKIKKNHPLCKVVMITAHDNISDRENALIEGVDFFIGKPFSRDSVYKALDILTG